MKYTIFEIYETVITEAYRHYMNNHFSYHHLKWPRYKKWFFERNPDAPKEDFYSWGAHYQCENWEDDINLKLMAAVRLCRLVLPIMKEKKA